MSNFLRQKYKEKPQAWGSVESVQRSLFKNAENIGINPVAIALAMPLWSPGVKQDYSKNKYSIIEPTVNKYYYAKKAIRYSGTAYGNAIGNSATIPTGLYFSGTQPITIVIDVDYSTLTPSTWPIAQSTEILLRGYGTRQVEFILNSFSTNDRVNTATSTPSFGHGKIGGSYSPTNNKLSVFWGSNVSSITPSGTYGGSTAPLCIFGNTYNNAEYTYSGGSIYELLIFRSSLKTSQIISLSDNPFQLWQRQPDIYFSIPVTASGTTYEATCEDILNISSSIARQATYSASCIESVNLSGADGNNALFQASTLDNINFQELATSICNFTALISSQFSFSDSNSLGTTLQAILSDSISLADSNTAIATLTANISDSMTISEIISVLMSTSATSSDSISIDDYSSLGSAILAIVSDNLILSDINSVIAALNTNIVDSIALSNIATALGNYNKNATDFILISDLASIIGNFGVSISDVINLNDVVNWGALQTALAQSGISIADSTLASMLFYASIADSIAITDNDSVNLTYNVSVSDVLSFSDTVSKIAMLQAIIAEQFNINDIAMEVSQLPNGKCSVIFTMKVPGTVINIKTATITFNLI